MTLVDSGKRFIVCEYVSTSDADLHAAQGVATDGTNFWTAAGTGAGNNDELYKWSRSGDTYTQVATRDVSADWTGDLADVTQINSLNYYNGALYVGANNYSGSPKKGWTLVYDPDDLTLISYHDTESHWSEGGAWYSGDFWVCYADAFSGPAYKLSRYNSSFVHQGDYTLPVEYLSGSLFHEGLAWRGDYVFTMIHEGTTPILAECYKWNGSGFDIVQKFRPPNDQCSQGLHFDPTDSSKLYWAERFHGGSPTQDHRVVASTLTLVSVPDGVPTPDESSNQFANLFAWYPLNEGTGTTSGEIISGTYDATFTGAAWQESPARSWVADFEANNDKVEISADLIGSPLSDFTVAGWFKVDVFSGAPILISQNAVGSNAGDWQLSVNANGTLRFFYDNGTTLDTTNAIRVNEWFHVAATLKANPSGGAKIYFNGTQWATNSTPGVAGGNGQAIRIGLQSNDNNDLNGQAQDVRFYDAAVSASVVAEMAAPDTMFELWGWPIVVVEPTEWEILYRHPGRRIIYSYPRANTP